MTPAQIYPAVRARLLDLASDVDPESAATLVPALPGWTVKDAYAHLAGVSADILAGRSDGAGTDPWTARQVAERRDHDLAQVCAEWARLGPDVDALLAGADGGSYARVAFDAWTHEHDVRGALNRPGARVEPAVTYLLGELVGGFGAGWSRRGMPAVRLVGDAREWVLGDGEPAATLHASDYELVRMFMGRRSRRQMLAMKWDGDPTPFIDHLHVFPLPEQDLVD